MEIKIIFNVNKFMKDLTKLGKAAEEKNIQKNIVQFEKDLYTNLGIFRSLSRSKGLDKMLINDPYLKKELAKVKISVMETVRSWPNQYRGVRKGENEDFFTNLSIVLSKIDELKKLNSLPEKQLKAPPKYRAAVRVKNIVTFLGKLTKSKT